MVDQIWASDHSDLEGPAAAARALVTFAAGSRGGLGGPGHLRVHADSPATSRVIIDAGSVAIPNTYEVWRPGMESYFAYWEYGQITDIVPTSGSPRSDLVIARVDDPIFSGTTSNIQPASRVVIPNVPSSQTTLAGLNIGYPAAPLARITQPPNNATILDSMITPLGKLANPRSDVISDVYYPVGSYDSAAAGTQITIAQVTIPSWATKIKWTITMSGCQFISTQVSGYMQAVLGSWNGQQTRWGGSPGMTVTYVVKNIITRAATTSDVTLPLSIRFVETSANTSGALRVDALSTAAYEVEVWEA